MGWTRGQDFDKNCALPDLCPDTAAHNLGIQSTSDRVNLSLSGKQCHCNSPARWSPRSRTEELGGKKRGKKILYSRKKPDLKFKFQIPSLRLNVRTGTHLFRQYVNFCCIYIIWVSAWCQENFSFNNRKKLSVWKEREESGNFTSSYIYHDNSLKSWGAQENRSDKMMHSHKLRSLFTMQ